MINMVYGGDDAFDAVVYGEQNPVNTAYFQKQIEGISSTLTGMGQQFFSNAANLYERFSGSEAVRLAKAAVRATKSLFVPDQINTYTNIGQFQQASPKMQRFLMAEPTVREMYHKQMVDGYSETYLDLYPELVGNKHYDYRRVVDGVVQDDPAGKADWVIHQYNEELVEGDKHLTLQDKTDILSSWDIMKMFVEKGNEDPTSVWNAKL